MECRNQTYNLSSLRNNESIQTDRRVERAGKVSVLLFKFQTEDDVLMTESIKVDFLDACKTKFDFTVLGLTKVSPFIG